MMDAHLRVNGRQRSRDLWRTAERLHLVHQLIKALAVPGRGPHHRHPQQPAELCKVHPDPFAPGLVQQVHTDDQVRGQLQHLEHQVQVALKAGGVADGHGAVRAAGEEKVPGGLLLGGVGLQGVAPGQVHQNVPEVPVAAVALGVGHCLAGPVSRMLVHIGKGVEDGALAHVGVAAEGYHPVGVLTLLYRKPARGGVKMLHGAPPVPPV